MRWLAVSVLAMVLFAATSVEAQRYEWCGYVLIEGLPTRSIDLAVLALEAITPTENAFSQPDELLQFRFNLAHTAVIVEGCFAFYPSRDLVLALLDLRIPDDTTVIDRQLTYTIFGDRQSRGVSHAMVRAYLDANRREWDEFAR